MTAILPPLERDYRPPRWFRVLERSGAVRLLWWIGPGWATKIIRMLSATLVGITVGLTFAFVAGHEPVAVPTAAGPPSAELGEPVPPATTTWLTSAYPKPQAARMRDVPAPKPVAPAPAPMLTTTTTSTTTSTPATTTTPPNDDDGKDKPRCEKPDPPEKCEKP